MDGRVIIANYSEIALKGKNRPGFEKALVRNIKALLGDSIGRIERTESRLIIHPRDMDHALSGLSRVFGIAWFSSAFLSSRDMPDITRLVLDQAGPKEKGAIRVDASRSDKSYPLTSPQINREVGRELEKAGFRIDLRNPAQRVSVNILKKNALISFGKVQGLGGLPVGTSGRVLSLLSGGIDSPVASWLMMKRGCSLDFLHVHSGPSPKDVLESKIPKIAQILKGYHPGRMRLFIAPYHEFYKKSASIDPRVELVVFRRFIFRVASRIAAEHGHLGIVSGDNIGQVASQTLENLYAVGEASDTPVYRPLATYDKQEIVDLAKKVGTYDLSVEEYKDCCSLVAARHPSTKVKADAARRIEEEIGIDEIVEKTLEQIEAVDI